MLLHLNSHSAEPLRSQIGRQVRARIESGDLQPGEALPSLHQLASRLRVSAAVVQAVWSDLAREGLLALDGEGTWRVVAGAASRLGIDDDRAFEAAGERGASARELRLAREIQCRLLPPPHVIGPGFEVLTRSVPARVLAGDLCDVLRHPDSSVGVVVADVAGKGVAASLVMASVKATLPFVAGEHDVAGTLRELGRRLADELGPRQFVALAYARFEAATGRLTLANAGLPDPLLLRPGQAPLAVELPGPRLPLGVRLEVPYRSLELRLEPGDQLLLYSDGLPEIRLGQGEILGYDAFTRLVAALPLLPAEGGDEGWLDALLGRALELGGSTPDDDCTLALLAARARPAKEG